MGRNIRKHARNLTDSLDDGVSASGLVTVGAVALRRRMGARTVDRGTGVGPRQETRISSERRGSRPPKTN